MIYVFWFSIFMIFYAYFGYPLCLLGLSLVRRTNNPTESDNSKFKIQNSKLPSLSFIITAYNEEKRIREKIENSLQQDYPRDKLEIIIASDCSTDKTDEIAKAYESQGVKLVRSPVRKGKEHAQKLAVEQATGDILVFSDVATIIKPDALTNIVANFTDKTVGCVSSVDKFMNPDGSVSGEGAYVRYEMFLRKLESRVNTLVGLSGSFFAARKEVCQNWADDLQSDFNTLLNSVKIGLHGISDANTVGYYKNLADEKREFDRKVRTVLRGVSVLMRNLSLLNPFQYGLFSWQLLSHKLCRWLVPFFLVLAFIANAALAFSSHFYLGLFILQLVFYAMAGLYHFGGQSHHIVAPPSSFFDPTDSTDAPATIQNSKLKIRNYLKLPYYFVAVNAGILLAWWKFLKGERALFWQPSRR